jgi:hypothetical protein
MTSTGQVFYFWDNGKIYSRSKLFRNEAGASFKIYTLPLRGNAGFYTKKSLQRIDISYRLSNASDSLKLYVRTAGGPYVANNSGWTLIKTITGSTDYAKMGCRIDFPEITSLGIGDFNQLEYYIEGTNASTDSCILHQIKTTYLDYLLD